MAVLFLFHVVSCVMCNGCVMCPVQVWQNGQDWLGVLFTLLSGYWLVQASNLLLCAALFAPIAILSLSDTGLFFAAYSSLWATWQGYSKKYGIVRWERGGGDAHLRGFDLWCSRTLLTIIGPHS